LKFRKYIEDILGDTAVIGILRTMINYGGKVFTVRSLAREANVTHNETALAVEKLKTYGIISIQPVGRAYHLKLNKKNYILKKIIEPIFDAEKNTFNELLGILKKHLNKKGIISAVLFGSVSRKEEKKDSDIDLLLIANNIDYANQVSSDAIEEVAEVFHSKISPIIFTGKEFASKRNITLANSILSNHTMICGKSLEVLLK